jgi:UDPglucose 6-dehydrogenase
VAVKVKMRGNVLVDLRNIFPPKEAIGHGFAYASVGRPT